MGEPSTFLILDKPAGVTSHDVVAMVKAVAGVKVGHTGTLDPFATGVLPLALGKATKLIQYLDERIKIYDATISLGTATDTGDPTGEVIREAPVPDATDDQVREVLASFIGDRDQRPPPYSAVKYKGKPLYWYARRGEHVEVPARPITVHDVELLEYSGNLLRVLITCSRGTYARVLADEIAVALGSAGHLAELCRTRSGPFHLEDALSVQELSAIVAAEEGHDWQQVLLSRSRADERVKWKPRDVVRDALKPWFRAPIDALSHLPLVDVSTEEAARVRAGGALPAAPTGLARESRFLVVSGRELVALAENSHRGAKALRVLGA